MHFRYLSPVIFCLAFCAAKPLSAQCYSTFRQDGIDYYNKGKWADAKAQFQEAADCKSDKPANNDLATWLGKCDKKMAEAAERARLRRAQEEEERQAQALGRVPLNREEHNNGGHKGYNIGDIAEDFSLKNVNGNMVSLSDYKSVKGIVVIFTCNHDPYAQLYEQRIIDFHRKFAPLGFPVVAINPNSPLIVPEDSFEKMQERAYAKRYPFAYLIDEQQTIFPRFGATRTPHVFVLDNNYVVRYIGAIDNNPEGSNTAVTQRFVENAIGALLKGEKPSPEITRPVGRPIKIAPK